MRPRDLIRLRMALGTREKEKLLRTVSVLDHQEKWSRSGIGERGMKEHGGVHRGK